MGSGRCAHSSSLVGACFGAWPGLGRRSRPQTRRAGLLQGLSLGAGQPDTTLAHRPVRSDARSAVGQPTRRSARRPVWRTEKAAKISATPWKMAHPDQGHQRQQRPLPGPTAHTPRASSATPAAAGPPVAQLGAGQGGDQVDDPEDDQVPGDQERHHVQGDGWPDEGEDAGGRQDAGHDEQPAPALDAGGHRELGDAAEQEGHAGQGGHRGQAAHAVGEHVGAEQGPGDPEGKEPPPDCRQVPHAAADGVLERVRGARSARIAGHGDLFGGDDWSDASVAWSERSTAGPAE